MNLAHCAPPALLTLVVFWLPPEVHAETINVRVSRGFGGQESNNHSRDVAISSDGKYVAFVSSANNLVEEMPVSGSGSQGTWFPDPQVYVVDISGAPSTIGDAVLVSVSPGGALANGSCRNPKVINVLDGQENEHVYVFYETVADNLDSTYNDNTGWDVYVRDCYTGTTRLVTTTNDGTGALQGVTQFAISPNGRHIAITTDKVLDDDVDENTKDDIYARYIGDPTDPSNYPDPDALEVDYQCLSVDDDGFTGPGTVSEYPNIGGPGGPGLPGSPADNQYYAVLNTGNLLDADDTNGKNDIYVFEFALDPVVYDPLWRLTAKELNKTWCDYGDEPDEPSKQGAISDDGLDVAFTTLSACLGEGDSDTPGWRIVCADISPRIGGQTGDPVLEYVDNGRDTPAVQNSVVAYVNTVGQSGTWEGVYRYEIGVGVPEIVSFAYGTSPKVEAFGIADEPAAISDLGDRIAYASNSSEILAPGLDTNNRSDVFVWIE